MAPPTINSRNILLDICASVRDEAIDMSNALPRALTHPEHWGKDPGKGKAIQRLIKRWAEQIERERAINGQTPDRARQEICEGRTEIIEGLCDLLDELEKTYDSESHASKLNFLFPTATAALQWLTYFANQTPHEKAITTLAESITINLAAKMPPYRQIGRGNLQKLFSELPCLAKFTKNLDVIHAHINPRTAYNDWVQIIRETEKSNFQRQAGTTVDSLSSEQQTTLNQIRAINRRFHKPEFEQAKAILDLLPRAQNSDEALPPVVLKSEAIGLNPGYYMSKLAETDVRNAMIGHFMGNCQHMASSHGQSCVVHAITSRLGALYVIRKGCVIEGETQIDLARDPIEVSSWTWRHNDRICFDSVEFDASPIQSGHGIEALLPPHRDVNAEQIMSIYYDQFALKLLEADKTLQSVTVGFSRYSHTPDCVGMPNAVLRDQMAENVIFYEAGKPYAGHTDAHNQRLLATRESQTHVKETLFNLYQQQIDITEPLPMPQTSSVPQGFKHS